MTIKTARRHLTLLFADEGSLIQPGGLQQLDDRDVKLVIVRKAEQVMEYFDHHAPDFVILNILNVAVGVSVCREIRQTYRAWDIPVIAIINDGQDQSIQEYYHADASDVLLPPTSDFAIYWRIKNWLTARSTFENLFDKSKCLSMAQSIAQLGYWQWDLKRNEFTLSRSLYALLGISLKRCHQTLDEFLDYVHPQDVDQVAEKFTQASCAMESFEIEHRVIGVHKKTHIVSQTVTPVQIGSEVKMLGVVQDVTEKKRAEEMIVNLSYYDNLTGLPNREFLKQHLNYIIEFCRRKDKIMSVLSVGIDQFSRVNNSLGHFQGDRILALVGDRLGRVLRRSDFISRANPMDLAGSADESGELKDDGPVIGRIYGDNFHIILSEILRPVDAARVASRMQEALKNPFDIEEQTVILTASIGIAIFPYNGADAEELMANADSAQNQAKEEGRNCYKYFSQEFNNSAQDRLILESDLRQALKNEEFEVYYQPKVDIQNQTISGAEALLRWQKSARGFVSPLEFIPLAEQIGLISQLGKWVLEQACMHAKSWQAVYPDLRVSVNVSSLQLTEEFVETVEQALNNGLLAPNLLDIEITEGIFLDNKEQVSEILSKLREKGVTVSVDDFGTGFSSLSYLRALPVDTLKVDRSFLIHLNDDLGSRAVVDAILTLAKGLDLSVVAEGVEDVTQLNYLIEKGCEEIQGYLFSKPLPPEKFIEWLSHNDWKRHFLN